MILVWIGVSILTFIIANIVPRDPVALRLGPKATPEAIAYWRNEYGLDQPYPVQFVKFLSGLLRGDLGNSVWSGRPVSRDLVDYLPATLELSFFSLFLSILLGIPLGVLAGTTSKKWLDSCIQIVSNFGLAFPLFWIGLVFQIIFYLRLGVLPFDSRVDLVVGPPDHITGFYILDSFINQDWSRLSDTLLHILLPAFTLSIPAVSAIARMTRGSTLDILEKDYIRMARAKGVPRSLVIWKHVLRNSLLPVITLAGNIFNSFLAGVFVVEVVFNWPGLGWYATKVILAFDYGAIVSITLIIAIFCTVVNLIVDILYQFFDPRIQLT